MAGRKTEKTQRKQVKQEKKEISKENKTFQKSQESKTIVQNSMSKALTVKETQEIYNGLVQQGLKGARLNNAYQYAAAGRINQKWNKNPIYSPNKTQKLTMEILNLQGNYFLNPKWIDMDKIKHADDDEIVRFLYKALPNGDIIFTSVVWTI